MQQRISAKNINDQDGISQFLLPPCIKGFNMRHKKWYKISADGTSDVKWNREAFQSLVIERKSKDLIQALVTSQLEAEKATDLISGKTGKTLTAEGVAEITEKPLYRVTCGDVE
ncbi:uncharacterized protein N7458_005455 [Penicillium daleae]|uniref:Uncharacterized protein n=1 Tax=Penicillium daleae TaxID=63821 RepID=A0AAD6C8G7_9EURO|nr:uncharacterized protein N7458_005455 [Penicillium daleae]KAJ5454499.1 hypothetical protein N7458_005455 [Penicillium daleae]